MTAVSYSPARNCASCSESVLVRPGRYPESCPSCNGALERVSEAVLQSMSPRLRTVLEAGIRTGVPWAGDAMCSPAVAVPLTVVEMLLPGGLQEFLGLMEGPTEGGRYFRVEDPWSPVLIAEVKEASNCLSVYASDSPSRWLGADPRESMVEDGGWSPAGWAELDEYSGTVDGRVRTPDGKALPDEFMHELEDWVQRYARKGALIDGEPRPDHVNLIVPVYSVAQLDLAAIAKQHGVEAEIGLFDGNTGIRWHPLNGVCESLKSVLREFRDKLPGGKADDKDPSDFNATQLAKGIKVELEHTSDIATAMEIAMDHLAEDPDYYEKLATIHKDEGENSSSRESCGVFIPVPRRLHGEFPERPPEDSSDPHVTVCYLGELTKEQYALAGDIVSRVCKGMQPFVIEMTDYGEFTAANGKKIAHMIPRSVGGPPFEVLHEKLVMAMREAGIPVDHHRDNAFKPHITLSYLGKNEVYEGPRPQGYWRCECVELWGAGVWGDGELGNTRCALGTGESYLAETGGTGGAGALSKTSRARVTQPVNGYGDGAATRAHGGFRFQIGHNRRRKPNKHVQLSIQNRMNQQRGLAKRIKAAKDWHASPVGKRFHSALNRYNRGNQKGNQVTMPGKDGAPSNYSGALAEGFRAEMLKRALGEEYAKVIQNLDDAFDALLRKLIRIESLDVLQDADFDEDNGAIYLYMDPLLTRDEMELILSILKEENAHAALVGSPQRELPGELVRADWWVVWAPYREAADGMSISPDPRYYAIDPHDRSQGAPAPQTFVKPALGAVDQLAQQVNVDQLVRSIGERVRPTADGPLMMFWSDAGSRTPRLRGMASGPAGAELPKLVESAARGHGALFLIRAHGAQQAREIIAQDNLGRFGPIWTNDRETTR